MNGGILWEQIIWKTSKSHQGNNVMPSGCDNILPPPPHWDNAGKLLCRMQPIRRQRFVFCWKCRRRATHKGTNHVPVWLVVIGMPPMTTSQSWCARSSRAETFLKLIYLFLGRNKHGSWGNNSVAKFRERKLYTYILHGGILLFYKPGRSNIWFFFHTEIHTYMTLTHFQRSKCQRISDYRIPIYFII